MPVKTATHAPLKPEFRYYCHGCTGVAFLSVGNEPKNPPHTCQQCGHVLGEIKPENFMVLEPNHPARFVPGAVIVN